SVVFQQKNEGRIMAWVVRNPEERLGFNWNPSIC
ncbi:MAG: hypothetical protein EZS28_051584, partial [Streblomastix strix]